MGCGLSDLRRSKSRRTAAVEDDTAIASGHEKKTLIHHGKKVRLLPDEPKVVLIFGGPGSKKGTIVNELIDTFGFTVINAERIILHKLVMNQTENQECADPSAMLRDLLRIPLNQCSFYTSSFVILAFTQFSQEEPGLVSLDWVMQEIITQLDNRPTGFYLVDILPNLKVLLKLQGLLKNVREELSMLESKYPVSFGINIEKTAIKKHSLHADSPNQKKNKDAENNTQSDEADFSRTEKRLNLYGNAVEPYLEYFKQLDNLISVDCSSGKVDVMWASLRDFLKSNDMPCSKSINNVIYFAFSPEECSSIREIYIVNYLCMSEYVNPSDNMSPEKMFRTLCSKINQPHFENRNFLIDMSDININVQSFNQTSAKKPVLFFEVTNSIMKKYMECRSQDAKISKEVKTVISTENEVYLFSRQTNSNLCKHIAWCITHYREDL